jgi:MFS family permease
MGGATFLIGCLPSYATAGVWAPLLLVVLRFGQGLAIGGEWGGAALLAVEHGHRRSRGWYGSFAQIGVPIGLLLANGVFALMSLGGDSFLLEWGWRISFWFGIVLTVLGLIIRKKVSETPLFAKAERTGAVARNPLGEVWRKYKGKVFTVIGTRVAENAGFFVFSVFALSYAKAHLPGSEGTVLHALLFGAALEACVVPYLGALSDRWGRRTILMLGNGLFAVGIFGFFWALDTQNALLIWLAMMLMVGVIHAAMYAPQAAFFAELFPTHLRYSGASLGYGLATPLAGGLAPLISTWLVDHNGGAPWLCAGYLSILGAISFFTVAFARETFGKDISVEEVP